MKHHDTPHAGIILHAQRLGKAARLNQCGRHEASSGPWALSLRRIDGQFRVVLAHLDRTPTFEEMAAVIHAIGGPAEFEPMRSFCMMTSQDGQTRRLPGLVAQWREIPQSV